MHGSLDIQKKYNTFTAHVNSVIPSNNNYFNYYIMVIIIII